MAKKLAKSGNMQATLTTIFQSIEKLDYQKPEVQALHQSMMTMMAIVEGLQSKLLASMEKEAVAVYNRAMLEQEIDRWKDEGQALGLEAAIAGVADELDVHPDQARAVMEWLTGQGSVDVSVYYREELRDLVIEMAEFIETEKKPYEGG